MKEISGGESGLAQGAMGGPSPWVLRFAHLVARGASLLDLACGDGRHSLYFAARGAHVTAIDRDAAAIAALAGAAGIEALCADLEAPAWPLEGRQFDALLVTRYLYRPRWNDLAALLKPEGVLIYETFAEGNERFGRPSRSEFLLRADELLEWARGRWQVVAYEQGEVQIPKPAVIERIAVVGIARKFPQPLESRQAC